MRMIAAIGLAALLAMSATTGFAHAKGCLTGAVVGGAAGYMVHHGVLGAAAGCAVGHHEAYKRDQQQQFQRNYDNGSSNHGDSESSR
jgi:hypothetical protein